MPRLSGTEKSCRCIAEKIPNPILILIIHEVSFELPLEPVLRTGFDTHFSDGLFTARIIPEDSTAAADPGISTLRSLGLLDVLSSTPPGPSEAYIFTLGAKRQAPRPSAPPETFGRIGVAGAGSVQQPSQSLRCSSSTMSPHRLLLALLSCLQYLCARPIVFSPRAARSILTLC
jgi:hypothetical protein